MQPGGPQKTPCPNALQAGPGIQPRNTGCTDAQCLWTLTSHPIDGLSFHLCSVVRARNALQEADQLFASGIHDTLSGTPTTAKIQFHQLGWL